MVTSGRGSEERTVSFPSLLAAYRKARGTQVARFHGSEGVGVPSRRRDRSAARGRWRRPAAPRPRGPRAVRRPSRRPQLRSPATPTHASVRLRSMRTRKLLCVRQTLTVQPGPAGRAQSTSTRSSRMRSGAWPSLCRASGSSASVAAPQPSSSCRPDPTWPDASTQGQAKVMRVVRAGRTRATMDSREGRSRGSLKMMGTLDVGAVGSFEPAQTQ